MFYNPGRYCKNLVNEIEDWKKTMEENLSKKIEGK